MMQEYMQLLEHETKSLTEKVRKLRGTLNKVNEDIKNLEKDHQSQVDQVSSQKRWVNVRKGLVGYLNFE